MKTLFMKHKWMQLVYGILLAVAGVLLIVFAINDQKNVATWLSVIAAITLFIYALALLFTGIFSLKDRYFDLAFIYAVVFIAIGVVLLCNTEIISQFITVFVATLLCGLGAVEVGEATAMVFFKRPKPFIVIFYLLGAIFITLGVLAFAFKNQVEQIIYVSVGILICITAVLEMILGVRGIFTASKEAKEEKENVIDSPVEVKEEKKEDPQVNDNNEKSDDSTPQA